MQHKKVTPSEQARQLQGATRLGPGVWIDRDGGMHLSVPEILAHFGWADTPAARDECSRMLAEILGREQPEAEIMIQELDTDG